MKEDIKTTQKNLEKELAYSIIYIKILDKWCNVLKKTPNAFLENSPNLLGNLKESVRTSLIFSMCNIFAKSNAVGLWRLVNQSGKFKSDIIEEIKKIQKELEPLRNIDRGHNIPWRKGKDKESTLPKMKQFLSFAEKVYKETIGSMGESYPMNGIVPVEFDEEIERNIKLFIK